MRNRLVGLAAATAIASAALVGCSPPNENPSDIKITDQENPVTTYEQGDDAQTSVPEDGAASAEPVETAVFE